MGKRKILWIIVLAIITAGAYFITQVESIYGGDAGDLVSAIVTHGIAHPPGYPLYTLLGIVVTKLVSVGGIAWRIGFLSSIAGILTVIFLFDLLVYLTRRPFPSFISSLVCAFLYPIWLYASVVEVFALNNLFTIVLLWCFFHFEKTGGRKYIFLASFIFGLALTHHHIILFLLPSLFYLFWKRKKQIRAKHILFSTASFILGLIPYLYIPLAGFFRPRLNWLGPVTFASLWQLVTRAGYGSFTAGHFIAHEPVLRFLDVFAFFDFVYKDFRILGIILILLGLFYLFREEKKIFFTLLITFSSYLFFLFYASFPLVENFLLGTFERFIQPLYIVIAVGICFGLIALQHLFSRLSSRFASLFFALFLLYPLGLFILNYPKVRVLKRDFTAENLGRDILNTVSPNSILIISTDTPLFNTQYVYYTENRWKEVKLVHLAKLFSPYYRELFSSQYPELSLPSPQTSGKELFDAFIEKNYEKFPIYSKLPFISTDGKWIPQGLLFRYYKNADVPSLTAILSRAEAIWSTYNDPLSGSFSRDIHLLLSDVLRVYAIARQETGFWEAKNGFLTQAQKHLLEAKRLDGRDIDTSIILSQVYLAQKRCENAAIEIQSVLKSDDEPRGYFLNSLFAALCLEDPQKASFYQKLFETSTRGKQTPLPKL